MMIPLFLFWIYFPLRLNRLFVIVCIRLVGPDCKYRREWCVYVRVCVKKKIWYQSKVVRKQTKLKV